jgi:hypothetical protein
MGDYDEEEDPLGKMVGTIIIAAKGAASDKLAVWTAEGLSDEMCVIAGTKILTDRGEVVIEEIMLSDKVLTYHHSDGLGFYDVLFIHPASNGKPCVEIKTKCKKTLVCTKSHPIACIKNKTSSTVWCVADNIEECDYIGVFNNNEITYVEILSINKDYGSFDVYNIAVNDAHSYISNGILSHNMGVGQAGSEGGAAEREGKRFVEGPGGGWEGGPVPSGGDGDPGPEPDPDPTECFIKGTKITVPSDSNILKFKNIEDLNIGDSVLSYNFNTCEIEKDTVYNIMSPIHSDIVEFCFSNGMTSRHTFDHPYWVVNKGWSSFDPDKTIFNYGDNVKDLSQISKIEVGDILIDNTGNHVSLESINELNYCETQTYNIHVTNNSNYFADTILVHNKTMEGTDYYVRPPTITGISTPYDDPEGPGEGVDPTIRFIGTDYSEIDLKSPDSTFKNVNPLAGTGVSPDQPEIISSFDLLPLEFRATADVDRFGRANDDMYSLGPKKFLTLQILSGIILRSSLSSIFSVIAKDPAQKESWRNTLGGLIAAKKDALNILEGYTIQTGKNLYVKSALQIIKSLSTRNISMDGSQTDPGIRGDYGAWAYTDSAAVDFDTYGIFFAAPTDPADDTFDPVVSLSFTNRANLSSITTIGEHFDDLGIGSDVFTAQKETAAAAQVVQELRRLILYGSFKMEGDRTHRGASITSPLTVFDDGITASHHVFQAIDFLNASYRSLMVFSTPDGVGGSGVLVGGIIPRGNDEDGHRMEISSADVNFQALPLDYITRFTDALPDEVDGCANDTCSNIAYLSHYLNRDFIMSRRWKLLNNDETGPQTHGPVYYGKRFNSDVSVDTSLYAAIDQIIGNNSGNIATNSRDSDSYTAIMNPNFTEGDDEGLRMLPFEVDTEGFNATGDKTYVSGYQTYMNSLIDDILNDGSGNQLFDSESLAAWASESSTKFEDLKLFVESLMMIYSYKYGTDMKVYSSNTLLFKTCCMALCKFFVNTNRYTPTSLAHSPDVNMAVPAAYFSTKYQQTIQLSIVYECMSDSTGKGFQLLEAYLRYRRDALITKAEEGTSGVIWPDLGDFGTAANPVITNSDVLPGGGRYVGAGVFETYETTGATSAFGIKSDTSGPHVLGESYDRTYWWEGYYGAFAGAYPRFVEASSALAAWYLDSTYAGGDMSMSTGSKYCGRTFLNLKSYGYSQVRYGLMATALGAALIQSSDEGEFSNAAKKPLWDYLIDAFDDYEQSVFEMSKDIETLSGNTTGTIDARGDWAQGEENEYASTVGTYYRGHSQDTFRSCMYWIMCKMLKRFVPVRCVSNMSGGDFPVDVVTKSGKSSEHRTGADTVGASVQEAHSIDSPFMLQTKFLYDMVNPGKFIKGTLYWAGATSFDKLGLNYDHWRSYNEWASTANETAVWFRGDIGDDVEAIMGDFNVAQHDTRWTNSTFSNPIEELATIAIALENEDHRIVRSLNILDNMTSIIKTADFSSTVDRGSSTQKARESYQEYMQHYLFGSNPDHSPIIPGGTIDELDDQTRTRMYAFFMSMNQEAVASSHMILAENFTLSTAFLTYKSGIPSPFKAVSDTEITSDIAHLLPASETLSKTEYGMIRWFMGGDNLLGDQQGGTSTDSDGLGNGLQGKKILTIGLPVGLLQKLRDKAVVDEQVYRPKAHSTSNYAKTSLIRIRVTKKSLDNIDILYTPRTFYFDAQTFYKAGKTFEGDDDPYLDPDAIANLTQGSDRATLLGQLGILAKQTQSDEHGGTVAPAHSHSSSGRGISADAKVSMIDPITTPTRWHDVGSWMASNYYTFTEASDKIIAKYSDTIYKAEYDVAAALSDPTEDFFGEGHLETAMHGISSDIWAYDQLSGKHYSEAISPAEIDAGGETLTKLFADHIVSNEYYSGILKTYIKIMTGMDMSERAFSTNINQVHTQFNNANLMTQKGRELYTSYTGNSPNDMNISKSIIMQLVNDTIASANATDFTIADLRKLWLLSLKTLPISADRYKDQALIPRIFDRTFCVVIDPEADFMPYTADAIAIDDVDPYEETSASPDSSSMYLTSDDGDGKIYCFVVDVTIIPMNEEYATGRFRTGGS